MGELLSLEIEANGHRTTVRVGGDLDLATAPTLRECLDDVVGDVVVDLTAVTFVDSSALALFIGEHKRRVAADERLTITGSSPMALRVFEVSGVDRLLDLNGDSPEH